MKFIYPNYQKSIVNVTNSILNHFGIQTFHSTLEILDKNLSEREYKNVILLLYDGMGSRLLENKLDKDDFLIKNKIDDISSTFPATTTAATTSVITGLNPCEHGWLGWNLYFEPLDKTVTMYLNTIKDTEIQVSEEKVASKYFPYTDIFELINKSNNATAYYVSPFGGLMYKNLDLNAMHQKITYLTKTPGRKFIYGYFTDPDYNMHEVGTKNSKIDTIFKDINNNTEEFCNNLDDSIIIIIADHGHNDVEYLYFEDYPELYNMLKRDTSLEGRACNLYIKAKFKNEFRNEFNKQFEKDFYLMTKKEILDQKMFGEGTPNPLFDSCIGDYIALAKSNKALREKRDGEPELKSNHAGLTEQEMYVPLIIIKKK